MLDIKLLALTIFSLFLGRPELTVIAVIAKAEIKEKIAKETTTSTRVKPFPKKDFLYFFKRMFRTRNKSMKIIWFFIMNNFE